MLERKPPRTAKPSAAALKVGAELYPVFRKHVPLEAPLTAAAVATISIETGLGTRRIRQLARQFRVSPIAESLASLPKGPKPGKKHAAPDILSIIDKEIEEVFLRKPPPSVRAAAKQIRSLLIADNGDYKLDVADVPSTRTIERMIGEISAPQLARTTMGSKRQTAHEPHPGEYVSEGLLDVEQMDHSPANVMLVTSGHRVTLGRPWVTFLIDIWSRCILGFYVSFGDPSIARCGRAVVNALLPKEPLLANLGLSTDYPMHGFFKRLHADFASAHRSEAFRSACHAYGIDPDVRVRGPSHLGGHIERLIGTMSDKMLLLPGATGGDVTKRDGQGPLERPMAELDAYLDEFSENRLHLVAARTLLLANAHCHDRQMLRRFAAIFALPGCPGTKPPVFPSNGDVVTLQRLESAICKAHRYDLRRQYRKLGAVERRLGPFCSLASAAFNATDWHDSARQALEEECRRRRCRDDALEGLHVARDYAERAEGNSSANRSILLVGALPGRPSNSLTSLSRSWRRSVRQTAMTYRRNDPP